MSDQQRIDIKTNLRMFVGIIWIAGAAFNAMWTLRHPEFFGNEGIARDASLEIYRWFFGDVVARAPAMWTALLILGEVAIGVLTLGGGRWARAGLWGGVVWSLWLFPLIWPDTIMMGPFALLLAWLLRGDLRLGFLAVVRHLTHARGHVHRGRA